MANALSTSQIDTLLELDSLEKQTMYLLVQLQTLEANTNANGAGNASYIPKNNVTISPNYDSSVVNASITLNLTTAAAGVALVNAVLTYL